MSLDYESFEGIAALMNWVRENIEVNQIINICIGNGGEYIIFYKRH